MYCWYVRSYMNSWDMGWDINIGNMRTNMDSWNMGTNVNGWVMRPNMNRWGMGTDMNTSRERMPTVVWSVTFLDVVSLFC